MAIKSSNPRKLEARSYAGVQFQRAVEDAWATRHDSDNAEPFRYTGHESRSRGSVPGHHRNAHPTHHPFSELGKRLRRH